MSFNIVKNNLARKHELSGKIKSITSATTVGAVFIYDTSQDSCEWRSKCKGLSWFDEASSATRSARSEFPAMALIVADNVTGANSVSIYDLDDPAMPLWMQFTHDGTGDTSHLVGNQTISSLYALHGRLFIGYSTGYGVSEIDFTNDQQSWHWGTLYRSKSPRIVDRNVEASYYEVGGGGVVNSNVNDVAATVLEGAEIGALGLPIPTVAVATAGGVSVIHANGDVYDQTHTVSVDNKSFACFWDDKGGLYWSTRDISSAGTYVLYQRNPLFADSSALTGVQLVTPIASAVADAYPYFLRDSAPYTTALTNRGSDEWAVGGGQGLSLYKNNTGNFNHGAVAYVTSAYNTGYLVGYTVGAFLANSKTTDHSVKGNTLTENGSLTATKFNDDLYGYSGWSASNYLSRASDTDFDFGTGDFSIMFWVKSAASSVYEDYMARIDSSYEAGDWLMEKNTTGLLGWFQGASLTTVLFTTQAVSSEWKLFAAVRRSGVFNWYIDGKLDASVADTTNYTPTGGSALTIGKRYPTYTSYPALNASFSLLRFSTTAPSPQQIKEIYEAEKPLFAANVKCLLAANQVNDLAYDKTSGLLHVASESTASSKSFRGLEAVESLTSDGSLALTAATAIDGITAAGGVLAAYDNAKVGVNLPALDVRAELNEGDDKLPDDGKFHFSGVTTDATLTTIAEIPMAANERMIVRAKVEAIEYQNFAGDSEWFHGEVRRQYRCDMSGARDQDAAVDYKYTDAYTSTMDIDWSHNSSNTAALKVTGVAGTRIEWTASVEVQRISDKTYER